MENHLQQEARVWNRVMGNTRQSPEQGQDSCPVPETVMELVRGELADACVYRYLAARVCCPGDRVILTELARQETAHARSLSAVYFVLTGKKACPGRQEPPCVTCTAETLRQQYFGELEKAARYEAMAAGRFAETFRCLAREERQHAQKLLCVMGNL